MDGRHVTFEAVDRWSMNEMRDSSISTTLDNGKASALSFMSDSITTEH